MINNEAIKIIILAIGLLIGTAFKFFIQTPSPVEFEIESIIENVVKAETGIDITPVLS